MKKSLITLSALVFAFSMGLANAAGDDKKADPIAKACKGKKAGDKVMVDGKEVACPEKKK